MAKHQARKHSSHRCSPANSVSPTEGTPETAKRRQRDEPTQGQKEREGDEVPTIIPFPSDEAQATHGPSDSQEKGEIQGDTGRASAAQRLWVSRARRRAAKKSRRKRDWDRFTFRDPWEKSTPQERLQREKAKYRRGKLLSGKHAQLPETTATIIPFPSDQAQAAGGPAAPLSDA